MKYVNMFEKQPKNTLDISIEKFKKTRKMWKPRFKKINNTAKMYNLEV